MPYKLSATLAAHSADVRAVVSPSNDLILSASRDSTAIAWNRTPDSTFSQTSVLAAGTRYVNAVTYIQPSSDAPQGYAIAGGQDTIINVFSLASGKSEPDFSLLGHTQNVCALHAAADGTIISGSWDSTAKVWKNFQLVHDLRGHSLSVWTVLAIDGHQFLTGSADKTIRLWQQHKTIQIFQGHTDAVRGLVSIPDIGFASCSNDSEIRVWTLGGDVVYTLSGHTSFIYSLSLLPSGDLVSSGEDRTVRVWNDGECAQTIVIPATSVWSVSSMPNGDIVAGSSDGVVRVFSASEERWASPDQLKAYDDEVSKQALPAQQVGDVKKSDLPGPEVLAEPGRKPGEVKMVRNGDNVEAHQWDSATASWQKIGDVVDAVGSGRKQLYEGKEYDYVFDVDIQDGVPPLKLPYNANENPYAAAQRFLQRNELSMNYIDEVVRFIEKNTSGVNIGGGGNEFVDPYTGASRYTGSTTTASAAGTSSYSDPYTGASRYTQSDFVPPTAPVAAAAPPRNGPTLLPVRSPRTFKQANVSAMQQRVYQYDEALGAEISTSALTMSSQELKLMDEAFTYTKAVLASQSPTVTLNSKHVEVIISILERWPSSQRFPVIDLGRLVVCLATSALASPGLKSRFVQALFTASDWTEPWTAPLNKTRETNVLLLLRALANAFHESADVSEDDWIKLIFINLSQLPYEVLTRTQRQTLSTVLFNFSCIVLRMSVPVELTSRQLRLTLGILKSEKGDSEAVYRSLVALGNVAYAVKSRAPLESSLAAEARATINLLQGVFPEDRVKSIVSELGGLL